MDWKNLGMNLASNPLFAGGLQLMGAAYPTTNPGNPFTGVAPAMTLAVRNAADMQQMQLQQEEWERHKTERRAREEAMRQIQALQGQVGQAKQRFSGDYQANALAMEDEPADIQAQGPLMPTLPQNLPGQKDYLGVMMGGDSRMQDVALGELMKGPQAGIKLKAGETYLDPVTLQPIAQGGPDPSMMTKGMKAALALGQAPGTPEYNATVMRIDEPRGMSVTMNMPPGERKDQELAAQWYFDMYKQSQEGARASDKRAQQFGLINRLLEGAYTGVGGAQVQAAKQLGQLLGMDVGNVAGPEAAMAISNEVALQLRNPAGGAGMPGAMSDADRNFLTSMVPGLTTTPQGRQLMAEVAKRTAKRDAEVAADARNYRIKNGRLDEGFEMLLQQKYGGTNIFADLQVPGQAPASGGFVPSGQRAR